MNFLVHLELRERGGLFEFWRALFERARAQRSQYDVDTFFATLQALEVSLELREALRAVWSTPNVDARALLLRELARQRLSVVAAAASPEYAQATQMAVLSRLMAQDCGGSYSIERTGDGPRVMGNPSCTKLRSELVIRTVAGASVDDNGLYAAIIEQCTRARELELTASEPLDGSALAPAPPRATPDREIRVSLSCPAELPPPQPYLQVQPPAWVR